MKNYGFTRHFITFYEISNVPRKDFKKSKQLAKGNIYNVDEG
jgi:hypothetical protein